MAKTEFETKLEKVLENILLNMQTASEVDRKNIELSRMQVKMFKRIGEDISNLQKGMKTLIEENGKLKKMLGFIISVSDLDTKSRKAKIKKIKDQEPSLFTLDELHNDLPF